MIDRVLNSTLGPLADLVVGGDLFRPAVFGGIAVVVMCSVLSVLVVVKRLGFVGQGVSHSAFGGIGISAMLAALGLTAAGGWTEFAIIVAFCVLAALLMALIANRRTVHVDTSIGLVLVGSMALGATLVHAASSVALARGRATDTRTWESILFGSVLVIDDRDVAIAWAVAAAVLTVLLLVRRPLLFWAFDEETAKAFGVPSTAMRNLLLALLAVATVTAMKLAGVVLATAFLLLPGATALRVSTRLWPVIGFSVLFGLVGLLAGLRLAVQFNWPPGPSIVLTMLAAYVLVAAAGWLAALAPRAAR